MNPNSNSGGGASSFTYSTTEEKAKPKPMKLGSGGTNTRATSFSYTSRKQNLDTTEGLYELANRAGLGEQADKMIGRSGGESQKYMSGGFIMDAMDLLNTGSYGMVGLVKGKSFIDGVKNRESLSDSDALGKYGWQGKVAGFIGDILLDPLTYIAPVKLISKIPGVSKGVAAVTETMFGKLKEIEVGADAVGMAEDSIGLVNEARKFKTADEFIGSPIFRGGTPLSKEKMTRTGISFSTDKNIANAFPANELDIVAMELYSKKYNGAVWDDLIGSLSKEEFDNAKKIADKRSAKNVVEMYLSPKAKILNDKNLLPKGTDFSNRGGDYEFQDLLDYAKKNNYDAVDLDKMGLGYSEKEIRVINFDSLKTRQELEKIWNKANTNTDEIVKDTVKSTVETGKALTDAKTLDEMESIAVKGQKTFTREGGWKPLVFLSDKLVYGFAASKKFLDGVQRIAGRNESVLGDAEKLFTSISKISPELFSKTITTGVDGRMLTSKLDDVEVGLMREGMNDVDLQHVRDIYKLRDNLMERLVELKVLTKETRDAHWGTYLKQSYDEYLQAKNTYSGTKKGIGIDSKKRLDELTPEMMKELGQVQDGSILWATTLIKQIDLVKKAELQKFTADGFAMTSDMLAEFGKKGGKMENLHQFPVDPARYGALSGKHVSKEVWNTLKGSFDPSKELGENLVLKFKHIKVVWNPASHVRNAFSATIQNWWKLGLGPWRIDAYYDAVKEFHGNGPALQKMKELGFSERSGYFSELMNNYLANQELMTKTLKTQLGEGVSPVKYLKKVDRLMLNSYGHTDNIAKVAGFKYGKKKGLSDEDAYTQAMAATFNYSEITPFVHQMRRAIWGVPFITFALKATPLVASTLINNPSRISVFGKIRNDLFKAAGVEGDQEAEAMPDYMRDDMFVMRLPWKDSQDRSMYFDMSYIIPFGALADGTFLKDPISANPILQTVRELSRNETFSGSKIFNETDDVEDVLADISSHVLKMGMPKNVTDFLPDGYKQDGTRVPSKIGWERFAGINTQDRGPGERSFYQYVFSTLGVGATPYELNSKESALAYTQRENLAKMLTENGVIKTFNSPYLPKDSELRPENQQLPQSNLYDKTDKPIGR